MQDITKSFCSDRKDVEPQNKALCEEIRLIKLDLMPLLINPKDDLETHCTIFKKLISKHTTFMKKEWVKNFPYSYCGISSRNLIRALYRAWYTQALYAKYDDFDDDHSYVLIPARYKWDPYIYLLDPTYGQMMSSDLTKNKGVLIFSGTWFEYCTWYAKGKNLFPHQLLNGNDICEKWSFKTPEMEYSKIMLSYYTDQTLKSLCACFSP